MIVGFAFVFPAAGALFLSMTIATSEMEFTPRLVLARGGRYLPGVAAFVADWYTRSAWGLKSDRKLALVLLLVLVGGVTGVGTGYLLPPLSRDEMYPAAVDLFLAFPAVTVPFVAVAARMWKRGGT